MAEKILNSRIIQKHDTEANWLKATNFKPMAGEVIIYDADQNYSYPRIKIGDGNNFVNDLPFAAKENIPTELPNPNSLTINGIEYDGSTAIELNVLTSTDAMSLSDIDAICGAAIYHEDEVTV